MSSNASFLRSMRTRKVYGSLKRFSNIEAVQSIYVQQVAKNHYSIYVFVGEAPKIMDQLLDIEAEILDLHQGRLLQFSYLQDTDANVAGRDAIMVFNKEG